MTIDEKNDEANRVFDGRIEQLNAAFERAEEAFQAMRLIVDTEYRYAEWTDEQTGFPGGHYIGMVKMIGHWRLCWGYLDDEQSIVWRAIRQASVEDRMAAANHLDDLRKAVVTTKQELISKIETATAHVTDCIENLQRGTSGN